MGILAASKNRIVETSAPSLGQLIENKRFLGGEANCKCNLTALAPLAALN